MIQLHLSLRNPFSHKFNPIRSWHGNTIFENKCWEFAIYQDNIVISLDVSITQQQDHAGFRIGIGVLGYCVEFDWYDNRHWIHNTGTWTDTK